MNMGLIPTYKVFLSIHKNQLVTSDIPERFWPIVYDKITKETFDAGNYFELLRVDYGDKVRNDYDPVWQVRIKSFMDHSDPNNVFLIDHAWTYRVEQAKKQLREIDSLRCRMCFLMGIDVNPKETDIDSLVDKIFDESWRYCNTYSIGNAANVEERIPVWYIMDELGCGIQHDEEPNVRIVPLFYVHQQITYSLLFPIKSLDAEETICRDFVEGNTNEETRAALLLPWRRDERFKGNFDNVNVDGSYFLCGHIAESLVADNSTVNVPECDRYRVYTECEYVSKYLTETTFVLTENRDDADILWLTEHFKDYDELSSQVKYVNQFPYEFVITVKDLLPVTCRRNDIYPRWLPITFNLKNELVRFVNCFRHRQEHDVDNHWIVKPFNLARGLDTHLTNNLNYILRLPCTGPKIVQKYIEKPLLFHRDDCGNVKFDVRYVILLKSCKPLEVYVYKNFFLRFANVPYDLHNLDCYEKHFTVMNYRSSNLKAMLCKDFVVEFKRQHNVDWHEIIERKIHAMMRDIFVSAVKEEPPLGIGHNRQSRALYAMDLMLEKDDSNEIEPKVLEINWMPDCKRACEYYPQFYNDIFKLLFHNEFNAEVFYKI